MLENIPKKEKAIRLRREGKTYSEILKEIPVAKSTLSEWFREVKLSKKQFQVLTEKRMEARRKGGRAKHIQRLNRVEEITKKALLDIKHISKRELWLIGIALYWAEGAKEKDYYAGSGLKFSNSDPKMVVVFLKFLGTIFNISTDQIILEIYIHENSKNDTDLVKKYWSKVTGLPFEKFDRVYYKKNKIKTNRRKKDDLYYGLIRVKVKSSSSLVRQMSGWAEGVYRNL